MRLLPVWFSGAFSCQAQNISICQGKIVLKNKRLAPFACKGIEMLVNLINVAYCAMKMLPYQDEVFSKYRSESVQEFRFCS